MSKVLTIAKYPRVQMKSGISKEAEEEQRKSDLKKIKSGLTCYEAIQFTQLSSEQSLVSMNYFFCRNFMIFSALRIMLFTLFMITFQNFPVLQISMIFIFCVPFSIVMIYNISKRGFITCKIKSTAYLVEEFSLMVVIISTMILIYLNRGKGIKLSQIKIYSTVISYTVIFAVLFEVFSIIIICVRDFADWCNNKKKQKKSSSALANTSKLDEKTISSEENIFENKVREKEPLNRNQALRAAVIDPKQDQGE